MPYSGLHPKFGRIILVLNILMMLSSTYHFLAVLKFPVPAWLLYNACVPATTLFVLGFAWKQRFLINMSLPFMTMFGVGGLFLFHWYGPALVAQLGHFFMLLAIIWTLVDNARENAWKPALKGIGLGSILFLLFILLQKQYSLSHPQLFEAFTPMLNVEMMLKMYP